jgi:pilus assembly protein CpaE
MASDESNGIKGDWDALILCPDRGMASELAGVLPRRVQLGRTTDLPAYPASQELGDLIRSQRPGLCFLDVCSSREHAFQLLTQLLDIPSGPPVVALFSESDPELVLRCLRRGAAGFLLRPFTTEQLQPVLHRIADFRPQARSHGAEAGDGTVYCVVPAKGSCGATTIASNLACQARLLGVEKVFLADMDPLASTLSFLLKLQTQYSFLDALAHSGDLDRDLWKALVTSYRGVDVLLSPESPLEGRVETQDATALVNYSRRIYRAVFLDCGGPYGPWNVALAKLSDAVLMVLTAELPAVYAAQRALAYLDRNGTKRSKVRLVVNRHRRDAGLDREEIETALGVELLHLLPDDREAIENALMEGRPVPSGSQFGKSLAGLATRLIGSESAAGKPSPPGGLLSLFSR